MKWQDMYEAALERVKQLNKELNDRLTSKKFVYTCARKI